MKLKALVAAVAVAGLATSAAHAAPTHKSLQLEINQLKTQQQQLQQQIAGLEGGAPGQGLVHVGPVGGTLIADKDSDGHGLSLMQSIAKAGNNAPLLTIGGLLEADGQYNRNGPAGGDPSTLNYDGHSGSDIYVDTARVYFLANVNPWVHGEMSYTLNDTHSDKMHTGSLLIGNLNQFPVYAQIGKFYPNAGIFSLTSEDVYTHNLALSYFRPDAQKGAALNFYKSGLHTSVTMFKTGSEQPNVANKQHVNDFAAAADYTFTAGQIKTTLGGGYVNNIVYTNDNLGVTGTKPGSADDNNRLPMADLSGKVSIGPVDVLATYGQTLKSVAHNDGTNSKLKVYDIEGAYHFHAMAKPMTLSLGYSRTKNFDHLGQAAFDNNGAAAYPKKDQWLLGINSQVLKNTTVGLEYARDSQYTGTNSDTNHYNVITADMTVKF